MKKLRPPGVVVALLAMLVVVGLRSPASMIHTVTASYYQYCQHDDASVAVGDAAAPLPSLLPLTRTANLCDCPHIKAHHKCLDTCVDPISYPAVPNNLRNKTLLLVGDSLPWQQYMLMRCLYPQETGELRVEFMPMHIFPLRTDDMERVLTETLQALKKRVHDVVAVVFAIGTWYNWDWEHPNGGRGYDDEVVVDGDTTERMLNTTCPEPLRRHLHHTRYTTAQVYEESMRTRDQCPVLLGREAFQSGLRRLQTMLRRRHRNMDAASDTPIYLWKEVPSQHYDTPSGQYSRSKPQSKTVCRALRNTSLAYERNRVANQVLLGHSDEESLSTIDDVVRNTFDVEAPLWRDHPGVDCTHYCNPSPATVNWVVQTLQTVSAAYEKMKEEDP